MGMEFSATAKEELARIMAKYPRKDAALLPALFLAQKEFGYASPEAMQYVAGVLDMTPARVYGVATFYTMYNKQAVGKYLIQVCTNISCAIRGGMEVFNYLSAKLGIKEGETTRDGLYSLLKVECLGACGNAPMMQINDAYYEDLTPSKVDEILSRLT